MKNKEHVHVWKPLITFKYLWGLYKSSYSKCECGLIRHDNDGEIVKVVPTS